MRPLVSEKPFEHILQTLKNLASLSTPCPNPPRFSASLHQISSNDTMSRTHLVSVWNVRNVLFDKLSIERVQSEDHSRQEENIPDHTRSRQVDQVV